jgi:phage shock protein C
MEPKRLYRSVTDRKIAGVAAGLADYFVMDPLLIRLAFVILLVAGGGGFLIYLILWIVTPENPVRYQPYVNQPSPGSQPYDPAGQGNAEQASGNPSDTFSQGESTFTPTPKTPEKSRGSLIGGLVLITIGALFLADELFPRINFGDLWPVILIVIGIGLLINTVTKRNRNSNEF